MTDMESPTHYRNRADAAAHFQPTTSRQRYLHEKFWGRPGASWHRPEPWIERLVYYTVPGLEDAVSALMEAFTIDDDGVATSDPEKWGEAWTKCLDALGVKPMEGE